MIRVTGYERDNVGDMWRRDEYDHDDFYVEYVGDAMAAASVELDWHITERGTVTTAISPDKLRMVEAERVETRVADLDVGGFGPGVPFKVTPVKPLMDEPDFWERGSSGRFLKSIAERCTPPFKVTQHRYTGTYEAWDWKRATWVPTGQVEACEASGGDEGQNKLTPTGWWYNDAMFLWQSPPVTDVASQRIRVERSDR